MTSATSAASERYARIADQFTRRVEAVPPGAWDAPAPCEGWVARDVVGHLVDWIPGLLVEGWGLQPPAHPAVQDDPAGALGAHRGEPRVAQHPEVLGDRGLADPELGRDRIADRARRHLALGQELEDPPPDGITENVERLHRRPLY